LALEEEEEEEEEVRVDLSVAVQAGIPTSCPVCVCA